MMMERGIMLLLVAALGALAPVVLAEWVGPGIVIHEDGSVSPPLAPIVVEGDVYRLVDDVVITENAFCGYDTWGSYVYGGVCVLRHGAVLDGGGRTIRVESSPLPRGAVVVMASATVRNVKIVGNIYDVSYRGIHIHSGSHISVSVENVEIWGGYGVYAWAPLSFVTVSRARIVAAWGGAGVWAYAGTLRVEGCHLEGSSSDGVFVFSTPYVAVRDTVFRTNRGIVVDAIGDTEARILNNTFETNDVAVVGRLARSAIMLNVVNGGQNGFLVSGWGIYIWRNEITTSYRGVSIFSGADVILVDNTIRSPWAVEFHHSSLSTVTASTLYAAYGVMIFFSTDITVSNVTVFPPSGFYATVEQGVGVAGSANVRVSDSRVYFGTHAIGVWGSTNVVIENVVTDSTPVGPAALHVSGASGVEVRNTVLTRYVFVESSGITIQRTAIRGRVHVVESWAPVNVTIEDSVIVCDDYGIFATGNGWGSLAVRNTVVADVARAIHVATLRYVTILDSAFMRYNSPFILADVVRVEKNYWHDYAGSDADGDGYGDAPYTGTQFTDPTPRVKPFFEPPTGCLLTLLPLAPPTTAPSTPPPSPSSPPAAPPPPKAVAPPRRWYEGWDDPRRLIDVLSRPLAYAAKWAEGWGGASLVTTLITLASMVYVWWHTKDALPAGVTAVVMSFVLAVFPELRLAAFVTMGFGIAAIIWKVAREGA